MESMREESMLSPQTSRVESWLSSLCVVTQGRPKDHTDAILPDRLQLDGVGICVDMDSVKLPAVVLHDEGLAAAGEGAEDGA